MTVEEVKEVHMELQTFAGDTPAVEATQQYGKMLQILLQHLRSFGNQQDEAQIRRNREWNTVLQLLCGSAPTGDIRSYLRDNLWRIFVINDKGLQGSTLGSYAISVA